jgi:inner membrane protein
MDNLCHTLAGAAIGEAGARKWTPLATAALIIGANLPDVDVLAYAAGPVAALGFRRGWTHGVLALALWPFVLTGLLMAWDRLVRRRRNPAAEPVRPRALLAVAAVALVSHPLLDFMNTYGVRFLMPFSGRWFYGDAWFIVDPYVWLALLAAIWLSVRARRRGTAHPHRPARVALAAITAYGVLMAGASAWAERHIARRLSADQGVEGVGVVMSPAPGNPLRWAPIVTLADGYTVGRWEWRRLPHLRGPWSTWRTNALEPWAQAAAATGAGRTFLSWSRLPLFVRGGTPECPQPGTVCIGDARYWPQSWAQVAIPVAEPVSSHVAIREESP